MSFSRPDYDQVFERAKMALAALGRDDKPRELLVDLASYAPAHQELLVLNNSKYWTADLCNLLVSAAYNNRFSNILTLRHQARLAVLIAQRLTPTATQNSSSIQDSLAIAWCELANALRVTGDLNAADKSFITAQNHLSAGSGDPSSKARLFSRLASLRFDQRQFSISLQLSHTAGEIWRRLHNRQQFANTLVKQAVAAIELEQFDMAFERLSEADCLINDDQKKSPQQINIHTMIRLLSDSGSTGTALKIYSAVRHLYDTADPLIQSKGQWLEGQLLINAGEAEAALLPLFSARTTLLELSSPFEAALVSLDLATALGRTGRRKEMRNIAKIALLEMAARRIPRETLASLILLHNSASY